MGQEHTREPRLYLQGEMDRGEVFPFAEGLAGIYTNRSPDKETPNEDAAALIPCNESSGILVVADGLGGLRAGELASGLAVRAIKEAVGEAAHHDLGLRDAVLNGIEGANRSISSLGIGAATTLAVVEIQGRTVRPYHVGDTMILVVGRKGKVKLQTVSHSPVGYALEAGFLNEDEAMNHEERHLVSNITGTPDMRIEMGSTIRLAPRDTLLLASDGLFDNLHIEEIIENMRKGPLPGVVRVLAEMCRRRMQGGEEGAPCKPDDLTFILFRSRPASRAGVRGKGT